MLKYFLLIIFLLIGCETSILQPPPKFGKGDIVKINNSDELGVVLTVDNRTQKLKNAWQYDVMFENNNLRYFETDLLLHKRAEWHLQQSCDCEVMDSKSEFP